MVVKNDEAARPMEKKFGCSLTEAKQLLAQAKSMGLMVTGVRYACNSD